MKVWLTRDKDGTPVLWRARPVWSGRIWVGGQPNVATRYGILCSTSARVKAITKTYHGCRAGGIVELEITARRSSDDRP